MNASNAFERTTEQTAETMPLPEMSAVFSSLPPRGGAGGGGGGGGG